MARYTDAKCKLCRREGEKLFLKGERCYTNKCSLERRDGVPGQHGKRRQSFSEYKLQLRAIQKVRRIYGVLEKQFRKYYQRAASAKGVTGTEMLIALERRLDNIVYKMGFGLSRAHARQLVSHGLILVNGKKVNIPSYQISVGDTIEVLPKSKQKADIQSAMSFAQSRVIPDWLSLDKDNVKGVVNALPVRENLSPTINEQLIVELYSR